MRSNKELLQLLLDNRQYFYFGLCGLAGELRINYIITFEEYCKIKNYIRKYANTELRKSKSVYYWEESKWEPREEWLKQQIKLLNGKGNIFEIFKRWFDRF
jgi:hypothetical protein